VLDRQPAARAGTARDRHRLRVALKKFRYLVETMPASPAALARLRRVQGALGELHDLELLHARLEEFSARHAVTAGWFESRRAIWQRRQRTLLRRQQGLRFTAAQLRALARPRA
jgi:CHAD domain-containing protein